MIVQEFTTEELATERWQKVPGFNFYEASTLGRVRSFHPRWPNHAGRILRPKPRRHNYLALSLADENGKQRHFTVYKLILLTFVGPRPEGMEANHIDAKKSNNRLSNLEYCTGRQNKDHAKAHDLYANGVRQWQAKLNDEKVRQARVWIDAGLSDAEIGDRLGVDKSTIGCVRRGATWMHVK